MPDNLSSNSAQVGIREVLDASGGSALERYQDLVVGSRSAARLLHYEAVVTLSSWVPGALGLALRRVTYRSLLGGVGRNVAFGHSVTLRHPSKIRIGDDVVVDDLVLLDAKGTTNRGITIGSGSFIGRGSVLSCKNGDIELGDHANLGFHCEIFSGSSVKVGRHGLFAAYSYLVGGGHAFEAGEGAVIDQPRTSRGITLGDNVWLGAGARVLDGIAIGSNVVVGANAVVTCDLPDGAIAAGVPARVIRTRE